MKKKQEKYFLMNNNIFNIINFLKNKPGYSDASWKKINKQVPCNKEEVRIARKLIKTERFDKLMENFTNYGTSYNPKNVTFKNASIPNGKTKLINTLFISDLHIPFNNLKAFDFYCNLYAKYDITDVYATGDFFDFYGLSTYERSTEYSGIKSEIEYAKLLVKDWYKAFPNMKLLYGNHVERLMKAVNRAGIPNEWLKSLSEILQVPTWTFASSFETDTFYLTHGTGGMNMKNSVLARQKPVIQGHHHKSTKLEYYTDSLWGCQLGAMVDKDSYVFNYAKENPLPDISSCLVLYEEVPIIEILK